MPHYKMDRIDRWLRSARRNLTTDASKTLVNSAVLSRLDYCNGILTGITLRQCDRLQAVLNAASRVIYGGSKYSHVTPLLKDKLHWLRFRQRVVYKLCLLVYKALHDRAPRYIRNLIKPVASVGAAQRLRSASSLMLRKPAVKKKLGERGFSIAAQDAWNALPYELKSSPSLNSFKTNLKTHLFRLSYG